MINEADESEWDFLHGLVFGMSRSVSNYIYIYI